MSRLADTPPAPYYAVIFTSLRTTVDDGYEDTATHMLALAASQPGFLGAESTRDPGGLGITSSYWADLEAISAWKQQLEHVHAQQRGRDQWYSHYHIRIARVERDYAFSAAAAQTGDDL